MAYKTRKDLINEQNDIKQQFRAALGTIEGLKKEIKYKNEIIEKLKNKKTESASYVLTKSLKKDIDLLIQSHMNICTIASIGRKELNDDEAYALFSSIMAICIITLDTIENKDDDNE